MARHVSLQWLSADQLRLVRPSRPTRLLVPAAGVAMVAALAFGAGPVSGLGLALLTAGAVVLPAVAVSAYRAFRPSSHVLVRAQGRLLLDGEPLEAARVELRVLKHAVLRTPTGYALSLWALVGQADPLDVDLGRFATIVEASQVSGLLEEFLERARLRKPGRLPTGE